ncbi:MAG: hypothetical protein ACK4ND_01025 [Cytophagaceae bacterium]
MIDPDKKVEEGKKKRDGIYQSSQHPEHFQNEGNELLDQQLSGNNDMAENANYDKAHGFENELEKKESDDKKLEPSEAELLNKSEF